MSKTMIYAFCYVSARVFIEYEVQSIPWSPINSLSNDFHLVQSIAIAFSSIDSLSSNRFLLDKMLIFS